MVLILLSWLYVFFTSIPLGIGFSKLLRIQALNIVLTSVLGLFGLTLGASSWAIFGPINATFHLFLLIISITLGIYFKTDLKVIFQTAVKRIASFELTVKVFFMVSSLLIWAQSATLPTLVDNETYYIQTLQWLNEYGFVPGLANLHFFLGQTSGWHITQSVYSFSFLYDNFNDLNGYLLLIVNLWAFEKLHAYLTNGNRLDLIFGLLPLTYIFLFQFVSAPSPDLPVYLICFMVFSQYMEVPKKERFEQFSVITTLVLFAVYIKITALVMIILPLFLLVKNFSEIKNQLLPLRILSGLVLTLFAVKNSILTGYPLFPLTVIPYLSDANVVPMEIMEYFFSSEMMHSFYMGFGSFQDASFFDAAKQYFFHNGIDSLIGLTTLFLLVLSPFIMSKYYPKQRIWGIYLVFLTLLTLLVFSSPQYRFFVHFTIFFGLVFLSVLLTKKRLIIALLGLNLFVVGILVLAPMSFSALTQYELWTNNTTFQIESILHPKPSTIEKRAYVKVSKGNLNYNAPVATDFFWITGKGEVPCVSQEQLNYFETYFHIVPQLRGKTLNEGFYAKRIKSNE